MVLYMKQRLAIILSLILVLPLLTGVSSIETISNDIKITQPENNVTDGLTKVVSSLKDVLFSENKDDLDIIVESVGDESLLKDSILRFGGQITHEYTLGSLIAATIPSNRLLELANSPNTKKIYKNEKLSLETDWALKGESATTDIDPSAFKFTSSVDLSTLPEAYANAYLTKANKVWSMTGAGEGQVIAIIDSGVLPNFLLGDRLIGGVDLTPDVGTPFEGFDNPNNFYHGTFVATQAAANARVLFSSSSNIGQAFLHHDPNAILTPDGLVQVDLLGTAPLASIYGIKVFSASLFTTTAIILSGIEHAILQNVDVINLSLGGASNIPGEDPVDLMVDEASSRGIAVVIAAGNSGPNPLQIGSPGTAISAITVGAASTPVQMKVFGEYIFGNADYFYKGNEKSITSFSSRGPTSDGRAKPDLVATGSLNLGGIFYYGLAFGSGTSYSSPVVAGGAALLSAYSDLNGLNLGAEDIKEALSAGADLIPGFSQIEQGHGYMNLYNSIKYLQSEEHEFEHEDHGINHGLVEESFEEYMDLVELDYGTNTIDNIRIKPSQFAYFAFEVPSTTAILSVKIRNTQFGSSMNPLLGNNAFVYLSTAMHNGIRGNYYAFSWLPTGDYEVGKLKSFTFEQGIIRLTIENEFTSWSDLTIDSLIIEVTETYFEQDEGEISIVNDGIPANTTVGIWPGTFSRTTGWITEGEIQSYTFSIPDYVFDFASVELIWERDYRYYGTDDLDFYIFNSTGHFVTAGAGLNAPEAVFMYLQSGEFTIIIVGFDIYDSSGTAFRLEITTTDLGVVPSYLSPSQIIGSGEEVPVFIPDGYHGLLILGIYAHHEFFGYPDEFLMIADVLQI